MQELYWRHFWQAYYIASPAAAWKNVEDYKTGLSEEDYAEEMPEDILTANTKNEIINIFIKQLQEEGYLHNHARMYLAAYIVHFRRIKWQAGAKWFLQNLIDAEIASNNLSFQWVASCFSNKPYIFNIDNIIKYFACVYEVNKGKNPELNYSYEQLTLQLFNNK
mgnify:CR=1 FL=1